MADTIRKNRWLKMLLIISGILLILVLIPVLFLNSYLENKLSEKLKAGVIKGSDSLYKIDFSDIKLNVLRGRATLYSIRLNPSVEIYRAKRKRKEHVSNSLYQLQVQRLVISGVKVTDLILNKKLKISRVTLDKPDVIASKYANKPDSSKKDDRTLYQKIKNTFKLISVDELRLGNIHLKNIDYTGPKPAISELKDMDVMGSNLLIDSTSETDTTRFLFFKDIITELHNYQSKLADGLYTFKVNSVKLSTQTKKLTVKGIDLTPIAYPAFFSKSGDDRFEVHIKNVVLNNFDYNGFQQNKSIEVKKLSISDGKLMLFSNYKGPLKTTDRLVTFPHWAIRKLVPMPLNIDTVDLKNLYVKYSEFSKTSKKVGEIHFSTINGKLLNITNRKDLLAKNNISTADVNSMFMGTGKLNLHFKFNLSDADYSYAYKGRLSSMAMPAVNPVLMPLAMIRITDGRLKALTFNINSTQKTSKGIVSFQYNNLKVNVLRPDYSKRTLITALANTVVLKHDNPDDGTTMPRLANVIYIRPKNFPFFKTVWHVLLNGIKNCAGVGPAQEKKLNAQQDTEDKKEQEKIIKKAVKEKEKEDKKSKKMIEKKKSGKKD